MIADKAHIIEITEDIFFVALTDKEDHVIAAAGFSSKADAEKAIQIAQSLAASTAPMKKTVDEFLNEVQAILDNPALQGDEQSAASRGKLH